jgi:hypothetical protein
MQARQSSFISWAFAALLFTTTAHAADCGSQGVSSSELTNLSSPDSQLRVTTANGLIQNSERSLPSLMAALKNFTGNPDQWSQAQQFNFVSVTDVIRTMLANNNSAITKFRSCDDKETMQPLISAARSSSYNLRINATLILGNVVDNTTVCLVLDDLRDPTINANGRANLLGVTRAVASYAYKPNKKAIEETINLLEDSLKSQPNMAQTLTLIADVRARAGQSINAGTDLPSELQQYCGAYSYRWHGKSNP